MFISTRINSSKLLNQYLHDTRQRDIKYKQNDNKPNFLIDNVKENEFYENYIKKCKEVYKEKVKQKAQEKTCWALDGIITFSKGFKTTEQSDKAAVEFIENLAKEHNVRVLYLVKHTDETTHHYHYQISTQDINTGKSIRSKFNNKEYLSLLQDKVYQTFKDNAVEVVRGIKKEVRIKELGALANVKHLKISDSHYVASRQIQSYINKKVKQVAQQENEIIDEHNKNVENKRKLSDYKNKLDNEKEQNLQNKEKLLKFQEQLDNKAVEIEQQEKILEEDKLSFKTLRQIKDEEIENLTNKVAELENKIKILNEQIKNLEKQIPKNKMDERQADRKYADLAAKKGSLLGEFKEIASKVFNKQEQAVDGGVELKK